MALRFFADHCISRRIVEVLREQGYDVSRLKDHLPTDAPDSDVIAAAQEQDAVLLSLNGDFADIVRYPPSAYRGIIALQIKNHPEVTNQVMDRLVAYLAAHEDSQHYVGKLLWNRTAFECATDFDALVETAIELPVTAQVRPHANRRLLRRINAVLNAVQIAVAEVYDPN